MFAPAGVHTNTRSHGPSGSSSMLAHRVDAEHRRALEVGRADLARVPARRGCCAARRTRTCPDGSTRPPRSRRAARTARRNRRPNANWRHEVAVSADVGAPGASSSTSASTATGLPSTTMSGLTSTLATSGRSAASFDRPRSVARSAARSTAGSPRNGPSSFCVARSSIRLVGVEVGERDEAERDVAERLREHAADAEHHARAELRVAHEAGDELAVAAHHRRDEQLDGAVVGTGRAEQLGRGLARGVGVARVRAGRARARSCARSRRRTASPRPGSRSRRRRRPRRPASARRALVEHGDAVLARGAAWTRPRRACSRDDVHTAELRPCQYSSRSTRLRSLPESVRGSSARSSYSRGRL